MKKTVKILIVDDDEDDFFIMKEYISHIKEYDFIVEWCCIYKEASSKICEGGYDLYFIDYLLGAKTGLDLIMEVKENNCHEPLILLTGNGNRAIDMKAMQCGAVDYLVKNDLSAEKLERCIRYSLERAAATKALKDNERKFRNIFERSKDTVFISDKELYFIEVNDAAINLLECDREHLISKSIYDFLTNKEDLISIQQELVSKGFILDRVLEMNTSESGIKDCIVSISSEKDIAGNIYYQGIIHEITSLKKAEKANLALEKMKMASRLVRMVAHEVRNPLTNILMAMEQIKLTNEKNEIDLFTDIIGRNGNRINHLITELMNSSAPSELLMQKISLLQILDESINEAKDRIELQNVELKKDYLKDDVSIMADGQKLKIAFLNIIINAVEAMPKDKGQLMISLKRKNDSQYAVLIQDNGYGISSENLTKLFEPYFTTKKTGMGLGLSSTLNILQSHNAAVEVDSDVNKGTVFKLLFNKV